MKKPDLTYAESHLRAIAQMQHDADQVMISLIATLGEISRHDAERVFHAYVKHNLMKRVAGQSWQVKHGAYLDRDTIRTALSNL